MEYFIGLIVSYAIGYATCALLSANGRGKR